MSSVPFEKDEVAIVPSEVIQGQIMVDLNEEFKKTRTMPCGFPFLLNFWVKARIRMAGVYETQAVFEHAKHNTEWHQKTFVKPGAPYSVFYALTVVHAETGNPDVGWISPSIDSNLIPWIKLALDPDQTALWNV